MSKIKVDENNLDNYVVSAKDYSLFTGITN